MKIILKEEKDLLGQQVSNMSTGRNFANNYIPECVPEDLPWYERDRLMTYIDQMKYKYFISDLMHISKIFKSSTLKWFILSVLASLVLILISITRL